MGSHSPAPLPLWDNLASWVLQNFGWTGLPAPPPPPPRGGGRGADAGDGGGGAGRFRYTTPLEDVCWIKRRRGRHAPPVLGGYRVPHPSVPRTIVILGDKRFPKTFFDFSDDHPPPRPLALCQTPPPSPPPPPLPLFLQHKSKVHTHSLHQKASPEYKTPTSQVTGQGAGG